VLPGVIGVLQANEALKILVGYGEPLVGRLLMFDAQSTTFRELKLRRDPHCPVCGTPVEAPKPAEELSSDGQSTPNGANGARARAEAGAQV
jgi:bacteriocin biosynthesis cyclodehydratase domain-containing protein